MTKLRARAVALAGCVAMVSSWVPSTASAGPKECIAAADDGQKLRDDGKLVAARGKFIACAAKTCPGAVAKQCSHWLDDVEHATPSVTFRAIADGREVLDAHVSIDGVPLATTKGARAMPIDPGPHIIRFERSDGRSVEDSVVVRPGEKNRILELSFPPTTPPPDVIAKLPDAPPVTVSPPPEKPAQGFHVPTVGWIGLGLAVAGGVTMGAFVVSATASERHLRDTCAPTCDPSEKETVDTKLLLANVGLGVGLVGLGVAVISTIVANTGSKVTKPLATRVTFDAGPGAWMLHAAF